MHRMRAFALLLIFVSATTSTTPSQSTPTTGPRSTAVKKTTATPVTDCGSPGVLSNGDIQFSNGSLFGSVATFICDDDFFINGTCDQNTTSQCQPSGVWSDPLPQCISKNYGVSFTISKNPFIEDSVDSIAMICQPSVDLKNEPIESIEIRRTLSTNSTWETIAKIDLSNTPSAIGSSSIASKALISGSFNNIGQTLILTVNESLLTCEDATLYQCYISYTADGQCFGEVNKQLNGFFFPKAVDLEVTRNGTAVEGWSLTNPTQLKAGDTLTFNCTAQIGNYANTTISWESSTKYSDGELLPGTPPSGPSTPGTAGNYFNCQYTRSATITHTVNSTDASIGNVSYSCYVEVLTPGVVTTKIIRANSVFHAEIYSVCARPSTPSHGTVSVTGTNVNSTAFVNCEPGYIRSTGYATCTNTGNWNIPLRCDPVDCKSITEPLNGQIIYYNSTLFNNTAEIVCDDEYHVNGSQSLVCRADGSWSNTNSTCVTTGCPKLTPLVNGFTTLSNSTNINSTASFDCYYGYSLSGNTTSTCRDKGWDTDPPVCNAIECPDPLSPNGGYVSFDNGGQEVNDTVTFSCYPGYKLVGTAVTVCLLNSTWEDNTPSCIVKNCTAPPAPINGYVETTSGYSVNSTATVYCNPEFDLIGNDTVECTANATWTILSASCDLKDCGQPSTVGNGKVITTNGTTVNDTGTIECDSGYTLVGDATISCLSNGSWSNMRGNCSLTPCGSLSSPQNGLLKSNNGFEAIFECQVGYKINGNSTLFCEPGHWSSSQPNCTQIECPALLPLDNGMISLDSGTKYVNDNATIDCYSGYVVDRPSLITCTVNGTWNTLAVKCIPRNCSYPTAPANGHIQISGGLSVNSTAMITCDTGYDLNGESTITCLENGFWNETNTNCTIKDCTAPPAPIDGYVETTYGYSVNSTATVYCNPEFDLIGNDTIECTANATWTILSASCDLKDCGQPSTVGNGKVITTNGTTVNDTGTIECDSGYTLVGDATISCLSNGSWSNMGGNCSLTQCGNLSSPQNGLLKSNNGFEAIFECQVGYKINGNSTLFCESGHWSSSPPNCTQIECPALPPLDNGMISLYSGTKYFNDNATVVCYSGYVVDGPSLITCTVNGTWNTLAAKCIPRNCSNPTAPVNGQIQTSGGLSVNATAIITCDTGYDLNGESTITCLENGFWNETNTNCTLKECPLQTPFEHSTMSIYLVHKYVNDTAMVMCDSGYVLEGSPTVTCTVNGTWDTSSTKCTPRNCSIPKAPLHGNIQALEGLSVNSSAIVTCDQGYYLDGTEEITCLEDGVWGDMNTTCLIKECPSPPSLDNGTIFLNSSTKQVNDTATVKCNSGYVVDGPSLITCTVNGTWNKLAAKCIPRNCSAPTAPANGNIRLKDGLSVNSSAVITCNQGYDLLGENNATCLENGSWSYTNTNCIIKDCGKWTYSNSNWKKISHVTYSKNTTFGSTAICLCNPGYTPDTTKLTALCTANGTWSIPSPPLCVEVECPPVNVTNDVNVEYSNGGSFGSTATFSCNETGTIINGYRTVTCLGTGKWTGSSPKCKKIEEGISPCPENIDFHGALWNETQPGTIVTTACQQSDKYVGETSRECTIKGVWKLPVYNCVRQDIENIDKQIDAIKENPTEEVVTDALDKLNNITKPSTKDSSMFGGEIEKVTSILDSIATISEDLAVTDNQAESFFKTTSNLLDTSNTESWKAISQEPDTTANTETPNNKQPKGAAKILDVVSRYTDAVASSLQDGKNSSKTVSASNLVLHVSKIEKNQKGISFPGPEERHSFNLTSSFHIPQASLKGLKHVSSVIYKNLSGILSSATITNGHVNKSKEINSAVVAVKVPGSEGKKDFQITLKLGNFQEKFSDRQCNFWNETLAAWEGRGCKLDKAASSKENSTCVCHHLTNFAILMSPWIQDNVDTKAIDIISTVGCSVSLLALILTVVAHIALWRYMKSDRVVLLINLCVALVISYAIFLGGVDRTENKDACTAVAVLLQYIYLVVFFLMLAEGIDIAVTVLYVFSTESRLKWLLPGAWLIPAVIVGISLGATQLKGYGNEQFCWLSVKGGLIWAFVAPAFTIILVNFVLLILVIGAAFRTVTLSQKSRTEKTKTGVKCLCVLLPIMGCTWVIGIFYVNEDMAWIQYVFAVCNSLQGLVIFLFHCALNPQIRTAIQRRKKKYVDSMMSTGSTHKSFFLPRASRKSSSSSGVEMSDVFSKEDASPKRKNTSERKNSQTSRSSSVTEPGKWQNAVLEGQYDYVKI